MNSDYDDFGSFNDEFKEEFSKPADYSIGNYPDPYCNITESLPTACFEVEFIILVASKLKKYSLKQIIFIPIISNA